MKTCTYTVNLGLIVSLGLFCSCATNPVTGRKQVEKSEGQEVAAGKEFDHEIMSFFGSYDHPPLQKFLNDKGQDLAKISHNANMKYQFKIVDSPVPNAFATPGGYIYFTRGLMASFNNDAEFAGVLAHELGHITAGHSAIRQRNTAGDQRGSVGGVILVPELSNFAESISSGTQLAWMSYGKEDERQCDKLGVEYSTRAGYDASEMAKFFETLQEHQATNNETIPEFLSTHPCPEERNTRVVKLAEEWKTKLKLTNPKVDRDLYLKRIDGLVSGNDPKYGFVENNIFYHPVMKFQFTVPGNWKFQNTPRQMHMVPDNGEAMLMITYVGKVPLEETAHKMLRKYNLTPVGSENESINGLNSILMTADQKQKDGTVRVLCSLLQYKGNTYSFMGMSELSKFESYKSEFLSTIRNFKELTDADKLNRKPELIRIKAVPGQMTVQAAFQNFNIPANRYEELAILNGMMLNDELDKGTLIKVVETQNADATARLSIP